MPESRVRGVYVKVSKFSTFLRVHRRAKAAIPEGGVVCSAKSQESTTTTFEDIYRLNSIIAHTATMAAPASRALRRCICTARPITLARPTMGAAQQRIQRRWASGDANPKIATIVDQISQLTLLETADLVSTLKVRDPSEDKEVAIGALASQQSAPRYIRQHS